MTGVPFSFGPGNEVNVVRYPGSLYLVVFDNLRWISYGCRFYIDVINVIATLVPRQVGELSVGFIRREDPCMQFKMAQCRISHAWIFKVAVCGSWRENTDFKRP